MKVLLRMFVCVIVGLMTTLALAGVVQFVGGPALFDLANVQALANLWQAQHYEDAITRREDAMRRCLEGKSKVVEAIIEKDLPLREAVQQFRELQDLLDDGQDEILGVHVSRLEKEDTIDENIVLWVRSALRDHPSRADEVMKRIEREMREINGGKTSGAL